MEIKSYPEGGTQGGIFSYQKEKKLIVFILEVRLPDTQVTNFGPALILFIEPTHQQLRTRDF